MVLKDTLHKLDMNNEEIKEFVNVSFNQHNIEVESKLENYQDKTVKLINQQLEQHSNLIEDKIKVHNTQTHLECEEIAKTYCKTTQENLIPLIKQQSNLINQCEAKIETLKNQSQNPINTGNPIQVICTGSETIDRQIPYFNGRETNPHEYLNQMKRFYEKSIKKPQNLNDSIGHLKDLLELSFYGPASRWLQLIKSDITSWEQFEEEFNAKFWNRDLQRGIKARIESEKYRSHGNLSRSEYFTERVILLQSISPPMQEEEIVTLLAE
jgi:hypothetical protein